MCSIIRNYKAWRSRKHQKDITNWGNKMITLKDHCTNLYIAYNGVPLLLIDKSITVEEALSKLQTVRGEYINNLANED